MNALEVKEHIEKLWALDSKILNLIYGNLEITKKTLENSKKGNFICLYNLGYRLQSNGSDMFFLEVILVSPNRFRPENKLNDASFLHG